MCFEQSQPDDASEADDKNDSDKPAAGIEAEPEVEPEPIVPSVRRVDHAAAPGGTNKTCGFEVFNHSGSSLIKVKLAVARCEVGGHPCGV